MTQQPAQHLRPILTLLNSRNFVAALAAAEALMPDNATDPTLFELAALCSMQLGKPEQGVAYLKTQLKLDPGDSAARFNLARTLASLGRNNEALEFSADYGTHAKLARLAGYLLQEDGKHEAAIEAYRCALAAKGEDWESWNNLGNCLLLAGDRAGAVVAFEHAINEAPGNGTPELFLNLAQALGSSEDRQSRLHAANEANRRFPDHHGVLVEFALANAAAGNMAEAETLLKKAAEGESHFGEARIELGLLFETANRLEELDRHIAECETLNPGPELAFLKAWSLRRRDRFEEAAELAAAIPETINPIRTAQLRAELAERLGNEDEAFLQYSLMNAASVAAHPATSDTSFRETIQAQTAAMQPLPEIATARRPGDPKDPIFIVGSPRSGTTLLDTLLGALPQLQIFEERPVLTQVELEFPGLEACSDPIAVAEARRRYFEVAEELEGPADGRRVVDKMPLHLTHMPQIHRLFPDAAIILVERHPCDAVLSCFMANFALNYAMRSYTDLAEAARTYAAVFENWTRARELYPLRVHEVRYERMILDLETEMRALLEFLDLPWSDDVLDNQSGAMNRGLVRTASYSQIGQPLYRRAVGRWRRYERHLEPAMPHLKPWIERLGYS